LKSIRVSRTFVNRTENDSQILASDSDVALPTFYEDDEIQVNLIFSSTGLRPAFLVNGSEACPFAPPDERLQTVFIPHLFKNTVVGLRYQTVCDRRGLHSFPPLELNSKGPFGFAATRRTLEAPDQVLIYPYYHPLERLRMLETRELAERQTSRVGIGTQVVGTREYRPGDSLRQIHWRSTARAGKLVVKEFAEEDQPSLTLALDLSTGGTLGEGKHSTFETAIRIAATLGYYAVNHAIPFRLVGAGKKWRPPPTPLSWWAMLNYLAKVQNDGQEPLADMLEALPPFPLLVVLISHPQPNIARALTTIHQRGTQILAMFITPDGAVPPNIHLSSAPGLEVARVSPYNWVDVLETL
jgi:uncharacterized protein (DUF58 family)